MMMNSKCECGNQDADEDGDGHTDCNNGQLLRDIEEISKALYLHNSNTPRFDNRSKSAGKSRLSKPRFNLTPQFLREDPLPKDKKSLSAWNWKKPLKALTHIGYQKFNCCFNLHVHSIEGLPLNFNGISLCVCWKRKSSILQTHTSRVLHGSVEFDETLTHRCSVYGSHPGSNHSVKYESKHFMIYVSVVGAPEHDIGNHHVDLTRLLPLTLEELGGDKNSGKWTTTFKLTGKAMGASLNVSFSYQVMKDDLMEFGGNRMTALNLINLEPAKLSDTDNVVDSSPRNKDVMLWQAGRFPRELHDGLVLPSHSDDARLCQELLSNSGSGFSKSISFLYQKLDEGNFHNSAPLKSQIILKSESPRELNRLEFDDSEFTITEQGIETLEGDSLKLDRTSMQIVDVPTVEIINADEIIKDDDICFDKDIRCDLMDNLCANCMNKAMGNDSEHKCSNSCDNLPCMKVMNSAPKASEVVILDPLWPMNEFLGQEHYMDVKSNYEACKMEKKSLNLDDITESVANDFLNMLGLDSGSFCSSYDGDPQSPREQLLRQFEKEALALGNSTFDFGADKEQRGCSCTDMPGLSCGDCVVDSDLSSIIQAAEEEHARVSQSLINRRKAKILEDLETDSLMQQWGLNERNFENSPQSWSGGFGSPIELPEEESTILPSIGQGLGSFVQTKGGGFLRSMNPSLFRNAKNCANLIIQASNPVILPAKMGNDILEILLHVASAGVEELCNHIYKLMPLQDVTGKSIKDSVWQATTNMGAPGRQGLWQQDLFEEFPYGWRCGNLVLELTDEEMGLDCVSLEAIAPMTIDKTEALLLEGLRIQAGMLNEEVPSYIHPRYTKTPAFGGRRADLRGFHTLEGIAKLQLESGEMGDDVDGLMGLSMTFDQWLRLDAGIIGGDQNLEQLLKILKAHHSKITELDGEGLQNAMNGEKIYGGKDGLLGNHLTMAFVIQLRDPLRNYEPVSVPMLVLTQVERIYIHAMQQDDNNYIQRREKEMENEASQNETISKSMDNTNDIDNGTPQFRFKINGIHLAGIITKPGKKQPRGTRTQQQSGFRWLLASGMGRTVNPSSSTLKTVVRSSPMLTKKLLNEDIMWSISYANNNVETNGKEMAAENVHIRNPDVIFPY